MRIDKSKLKCPECNTPLIPATSISGAESEDWMQCPKCPVYVDTYIPLPHQAIIHKDPSRYIGVFGGYASGKTKVDYKDEEKHILITPQGRSLVGAKIMPQVEQTFKLEFENDFPIDFVRHVNKQKSYIDFINSHRLLYRPLYDQEVLRSLNLTCVRIVEASGCDHSEFTQLQTRLRNGAAVIYEPNTYDDDGNPTIKADYRKFVLESNPDAGWIRSEYLLRSNTIFLHGKESHEQEYYIEQPDENKSSHIIPTSANIHVPIAFLNEVAAGKPNWWINRYLKGSFDYSEGLVYPEALKTIIAPIPIGRHWKHFVSMDYGINDNTHILFGAVDPQAKVLYIYHEIVTNRMNVKEIVALYKQDLLTKIPLGGLYKVPVMDGRSYGQPLKTDVKKTLGDLFLDEGVVFNPAKMDLHARIMKTNTLIEFKQLRIFSTCTGLIKEILEYKFPEKSLDNTKSPDKPVDKNNHGVNALEFLVMEVPHNLELNNANAYDNLGQVIKGYLGRPKPQLANKDNYYNPFEDTQQTTSDNPFYNSVYGGF